MILNSTVRYSALSGITLSFSSSPIQYVECYSNANAGIEVQGSGYTPQLDHVTSCNNNYGFEIYNDGCVSIKKFDFMV